MSSCGVCAKSISPRHLKLDCADCKREFHANCMKMSKADVECITADELVWRCNECSSSRRKSMRLDSQVCEGSITLDDIMAAINELKSSQREYEGGVNKAFEEVNAKLQDTRNIILEEGKKSEGYFKVVEELLAENKALKQKVQFLEGKLEDMEQYSRSNTLEIHGIPEEKNENVVQVIKEVGKALDLDISDSMIDACHRLGKRHNNSPPAIVVKFVRRIDKEEFMRRRRVKRTLSTRHINRPVDQPIYVNDSMTPERRRLLALSRAVKREKSYKYLWVRNGKIFLRKEENAPVIVVTRQDDLSKL